MKKMILTVGIAALLVACQDVVENESVENSIEVINGENKSVLENEILKSEAERDAFEKASENKYKHKENTTYNEFESFDFLKDIQVVEVKESNNSAVKEEIKGGLSTTKASYDSKYEKLFIYGDIRNKDLKEESNVISEENEAPKWIVNEDTSMIVIEDVSSLGKLISNTFHPTEESSFKSNLSPVNKEMVKNKNRLFLNKTYEIKKLENGIVELTFQGEKHLINPGESFKAKKEQNDINSTFEILNYGVLDSSVDIVFQDPTQKFFVDESDLTGKGLYESINKKELEKLLNQ